MLMAAERSVLVIVDVQERLCPVIADARRVLRGCRVLIQAARRLAVPVVATEQYPQGLGPTMVDLRELLAPGEVLPKMTFSLADDAAVLARLEGLARPQLVLAGIEAHVCVLQSALRLNQLGWRVFVVEDCCGSRDPENARRAAARLNAAGVGMVSLEMVVFEWLQVAGTAAFKELINLIK